MTIITLSGAAGSGKDTMADVLVKKHGFVKISLADPLRELCCKVFGMQMNEFLDRDKKDARIQRIHVDFHHIDKIRDIVLGWGYEISYEAREEMEEYHGKELDTPREVLRFVANKLLRDHVDSNIFIDLAFNKIREVGGKVVIPDVRFDNEREVFGKAGATMALIKRPGVKVESKDYDLGDEDEYDVIFTNDGELHVFQSEVDTWYTIKRDELSRYTVFKYYV